MDNLSITAARLGYMKVRLTYLTDTPKHIRSLMLAGVGAFPPFLEDICILLPRMQVFTLLETFLPMFKTLQEAGVVSVNDTLTGFKLLNEDKLTLGYVVG